MGKVEYDAVPFWAFAYILVQELLGVNASEDALVLRPDVIDISLSLGISREFGQL